MQGWDLYYHPSHYNNYDYGGFINGKSNDKKCWQLRNGFGVSIIFQEFCVLLTLDNIIQDFVDGNLLLKKLIIHNFEWLNSSREWVPNQNTYYITKPRVILMFHHWTSKQKNLSTRTILQFNLSSQIIGFPYFVLDVTENSKNGSCRKRFPFTSGPFSFVGSLLRNTPLWSLYPSFLKMKTAYYILCKKTLIPTWQQIATNFPHFD